MGSDRDVVILADDIDVPVGCMCDDVDLWVKHEEVRQDIAHRELHRGHRRRAAHRTDRFSEPTADGVLGEFGVTQHHDRVAIEFLTGVGHREPPRGPVEQPHPELRLEPLDAMAQC